MAWRWEEIQESCPSTDDHPHLGLIETPEEVVAAFERVERYLGGEWIDASPSEGGGGPSFGAHTVFTVVNTARQLASLEGATGCNGPIAKLRRNDQSARAELAAICRSTEGQTDVRVRARMERERRVRGIS